MAPAYSSGAGASLPDKASARARVVVLDAAVLSADLHELGTISDLAAAAVRQWAPCARTSKSSDAKAASRLAASEQGPSAGGHLPHSVTPDTCSAEQRDLAKYATGCARELSKYSAQHTDHATDEVE